jgi:hypothetical protein
MNQHQSSTVLPEAARLHGMHWTVVLEAAQSYVPRGPAALARLCARYRWPPYGCTEKHESQR